MGRNSGDRNAPPGAVPNDVSLRGPQLRRPPAPSRCRFLIVTGYAGCQNSEIVPMIGGGVTKTVHCASDYRRHQRLHYQIIRKPASCNRRIAIGRGLVGTASLGSAAPI